MHNCFRFLVICAFILHSAKMGRAKNPLGEVVKEINDAKIVMDSKETKKCVEIMKKVIIFEIWNTPLFPIRVFRLFWI